MIGQMMEDEEKAKNGGRPKPKEKDSLRIKIQKDFLDLIQIQKSGEAFLNKMRKIREKSRCVKRS